MRRLRLRSVGGRPLRVWRAWRECDPSCNYKLNRETAPRNPSGTAEGDQGTEGDD